MARVLAHPGRLRWHWPSAHFWHMLALTALWLVIISLGIVLIGSIVYSVVATLGQTPYFQGGGSLGAALPLGFLATFMSFTMLPLFMPLVIPVIGVALVVALPFTDAARHQYARVWHTVNQSG